MQNYDCDAVITLNSITVSGRVRAGSQAEADALFREQISAGDFNADIDGQAQGRDFEVDEVTAELAEQ